MEGHQCTERHARLSGSPLEWSERVGQSDCVESIVGPGRPRRWIAPSSKDRAFFLHVAEVEAGWPSSGVISIDLAEGAGALQYARGRRRRGAGASLGVNLVGRSGASLRRFAGNADKALARRTAVIDLSWKVTAGSPSRFSENTHWRASPWGPLGPRQRAGVRPRFVVVPQRGHSRGGQNFRCREARPAHLGHDQGTAAAALEIAPSVRR